MPGPALAGCGHATSFAPVGDVHNTGQSETRHGPPPSAVTRSLKLAVPGDYMVTHFERSADAIALGNLSATLMVGLAGTGQAQDAREFVRMPEPMQEHMLSNNMCDHLATLNKIIGGVANNEFDTAAKLAEE